MTSRHQIHDDMPGSNPFEQTAVFLIARLNSQIEACDALLSRLVGLEQKKAELAQEEKSLSDKDQEIDERHSSQLTADSNSVLQAQDALCIAESTVRGLRRRHKKLKERFEALQQGELLQEDLDHVARAIEEESKPLKDNITKVEERISETQRYIDELTELIESQKADLNALRADLESFRRRKVPARFLPPVYDVRKKAAEKQDKKIRDLKDKQNSLIDQYKQVEMEIAPLNKIIVELEANNSELKQVSKKKIFNRLGSTAWWGSFTVDYAKKAQKVIQKRNLLTEQLAGLKGQFSKEERAFDAATSERSQVIKNAALAEFSHQRGLLQEMIETVLAKIREREAQLSLMNTALSSLEDQLEENKEKLNQVGNRAAENSRQEIVELVKASLDKSDIDIQEADNEAALNRGRVLEATTALEQLRSNLSSEKSEQMLTMGHQLDELRKSVHLAEEAFFNDARGYNIEISAGDIREIIIQKRSELVSELKERQDGLTLNENHGSSSQENGVRNNAMEFEERSPSGSQGAIVNGNIYFDFVKNENDNQDARGRTFTGLRSQLDELHLSHGNALFPDSPSGEDLLSTFIDTFFPEGITQSYYICNLSLQSDQPYLSIRPQIVGPRLERLLPRGMSLAVCGRLWDNQRDVDNPVFLVQRIVDLSHSGARPFEHLISGFVFSQYQSVYPASKRQENVLSNEFVSQLPSISVQTRDRLQDWRAYLDWRERLVHARLVGLRYLEVDVLEDGRLRFLTVCESKVNFDQVRRMLRSNELYAYELNYSQDSWQFDYNDKHRERGAELGDFAGQEDVPNPGDVDTEGMPWDEPYFSYIHFRLPEEAQNEFDDILKGGGTIKEAAKSYLNRVHPSGFLALSIMGDRILIDRQRKELYTLQRESGYAPFLSSYLFDIKKANEPSKLKQITDGQWLQPSLNDDQRLAVQKMVSTPDLAMVQGPPGTGKTTMIAEATWQFVNEGKKILIVSQASLAVNNALERLLQIPAIRAIRLSRRERKNEGEHPYSQERALETYYGSIANACRNRTLDVWAGADARLVAITNWIASVDLVSGDVESLRSKADVMAKEYAALEAELKRHEESDKRARNIARQRREAAELRAFIGGADSFTGTIPEKVLRTVYDRIMLPLDRLSDIGVRANALWTQYDYGSPSERTRFAVEALLNWRKVIAFKAQITGDCERLKATEGNSVLSPESAIRLAELQRKLEATQKAMEKDASKVSKWQTIQKEIREVKRQGAGLDRNIYARLFNVPDNQSLPILTDSGSTRTKVIDVLDQAYGLLCVVETEIENGCRGICEQLDRYVESLAGVDVDRGASRRLEGELRHLSERQKEVSSELSDKEKRLRDILGKQPGMDQGVKPDLAELPDLRAIAEHERSSLTATVNQSQAFRDSWGNLLQRWVSDLTDPETIRCDQDNFFPTYIRACNVVGVTCTENRRTLEDAGHTWFDAVVVDEVSKATPTEIIMPLMMGKTAILVGDHRQLPPLFKEHEGSWEEAIADQEESPEDEQNSDSELTAQNFDRFKKMVTSSLFKEHFENAPESLKSFLFTQYRMHPQIMRVVNQFYENNLQCGLPDPDGKVLGSDPRGHRIHGLTLNGEKSQQYIVPNRHVAWLDSTLDPHRRPHYERRDLGSSKVNELECILIAKVLCDIEISCREQGFGSNGKPPKQVGIITFYGRQVRAIREAIHRTREMHKVFFYAIEYDINTVDRYQGQERPIILVSMVRNPPFRLSQRANTAQFERINVAFSRAQELLIVAGAKDVFCRYPVFLPHLDRPGKRKVEVYRYIIDEIQRNSGLWSSDYIINPHKYDSLLPKDYSAKLSRHGPNKNIRGRKKNDNKGKNSS